MSDFKAKLHQNTKFGWGSALDPARGAYSSPGPVAGCKGSTTEGSGVEGTLVNVHDYSVFFFCKRRNKQHTHASKTTALNTKQQTCSLCNVQTTQNRQFRMTSIPGMSYQNTVFHCQST